VIDFKGGSRDIVALDLADEPDLEAASSQMASDLGLEPVLAKGTRAEVR
jgi:hypothetical protein